MLQSKNCKYCGSNLHGLLQCFDKPRKPLRHASPKTVARSSVVRREWFLANKPDSDGLWQCYLQIAPNCLRTMDRMSLQLEHVRSRSRYPELKYEVTNLRPSCHFCNHIKASLDLEDLVVEYPHLKELL